MIKNIKSCLTALAIIPLIGLVYPFGVLNSNPTQPSSNKVTILVHGFLHNRTAWLYLKYRLKEHPELGSIFTINLGHPFQSIEDYTEKLKKLIEDILNKTPDGILEVNFVAHSMGGLVCANYAVNLPEKGPTRINKIVTIASPLQGTETANLAKYCPCAYEMLPSGHFIKGLQEKVKQKSLNDHFFHIGCGQDSIVQENHTFFLGGRNDRVAKNLGHLECLISPKVADYVIEGLLQKNM